MTIIPIEFASPEYDQTIKLRYDILREPLGLDFSVEDIEVEYLSHHLACFDEHFRLLGCLVLRPLADGEIKMRQVAVAQAAQGMGIGTRLVEASEVYARDLGFGEMVLNARTTAVPFYKRMAYDTEGEPFEEVSVEHYKMRKSL